MTACKHFASVSWADKVIITVMLERERDNKKQVFFENSNALINLIPVIGYPHDLHVNYMLFNMFNGFQPTISYSFQAVYSSIGYINQSFWV